MVATTQLVEILEKIKPAIQTVAQDNPFGRPSNFEVQVAMAFCLFRQELVDVAVVEVGLGGSLDATNVLPAKIAVLTNVGLDHTEILGDTVELITQDKAGIIKPGQIVISGLTQPATQQIVADRCTEMGATLWQLGDHFRVTDEEKIELSNPKRSVDQISLQMRGNYQLTNAACAVAACHAFSPNLPNAVYQTGLHDAVIPGRMEIMQDIPIVILDGAHNPDKMRAAVQAVHHDFPDKKRTVVFALKSGKDAQEILSALVKDTATLIITTFTNELWDACDPLDLAQTAQQLAPDLEILIQPDPIQAVAQALSISEGDGLVLITGSLYLIGNVREYWVPTDDLILQAEGILAL